MKQWNVDQDRFDMSKNEADEYGIGWNTTPI